MASGSPDPTARYLNDATFWLHKGTHERTAERNQSGERPASTDVHFAEDDGSQGQFTGFFDALTPATLTPPGGSAGNTE